MITIFTTEERTIQASYTDVTAFHSGVKETHVSVAMSMESNFFLP
jgi:hypothetical protein